MSNTKIIVKEMIIDAKSFLKIMRLVKEHEPEIWEEMKMALKTSMKHE